MDVFQTSGTSPSPGRAAISSYATLKLRQSIPFTPSLFHGQSLSYADIRDNYFHLKGAKKEKYWLGAVSNFGMGYKQKIFARSLPFPSFLVTDLERRGWYEDFPAPRINAYLPTDDCEPIQKVSLLWLPEEKLWKTLETNDDDWLLFDFLLNHDVWRGGPWQHAEALITLSDLFHIRWPMAAPKPVTVLSRFYAYGNPHIKDLDSSCWPDIPKTFDRKYTESQKSQIEVWLKTYSEVVDGQRVFKQTDYADDRMQGERRGKPIINVGGSRSRADGTVIQPAAQTPAFWNTHQLLMPTGRWYRVERTLGDGWERQPGTFTGEYETINVWWSGRDDQPLRQFPLKKMPPSDLSLGSLRPVVVEQIEATKQVVEALQDDYYYFPQTIRERYYLKAEKTRPAKRVPGFRLPDESDILLGALEHPSKELQEEWNRRLREAFEADFKRDDIRSYESDVENMRTVGIENAVDENEDSDESPEEPSEETTDSYDDIGDSFASAWGDNDEHGNAGFDRASDHIDDGGARETTGVRTLDHEERKIWFNRWRGQFNDDGSLTGEDVPTLLEKPEFQLEVGRYRTMFSGDSTAEVAREQGIDPHTMTVRFSENDTRSRYADIDFVALSGRAFCIVELHGRNEVKDLGPFDAPYEKIRAAKQKHKKKTISNAFKKIRTRSKALGLKETTVQGLMLEAAVKIHLAYEDAVIGILGTRPDYSAYK